MADDIAALNMSDVKASIDAGQLAPGTHEVEVALDFGEGIFHDPVKVSVTVTVIDDAPAQPAPHTPAAPVEEPDEGEENSRIDEE